jgi:hypothetical protein
VMPVANKRDLCGARSRPFLILSLLKSSSSVFVIIQGLPATAAEPGCDWKMVFFPGFLYLT